MDMVVKTLLQKVIKVFAKPIALFQANPNLVFVPSNPVKLYNLSAGAVNYSIGILETEIHQPKQVLLHSYQEAGEYQIFLVASNIHGCVDTFNLPSKIIAELESGIEIPNAFSPNQTAEMAVQLQRHE
jgi:hypothetical protein